MKTLRNFILTDTLLLVALGLGVAFIHPGSSPALYLKVEVSRSSASLDLLAAGLSVLALVLWMSTELPLVSDRRQLALGLSFANLLIAVLAFLQTRVGAWEPALGGCLVAIFLGLAGGLAWTGLRLRRPEEIAAEIAALKIPDEIRRGLLQQIGEAAAQEERNRLARDLHDSIKQQLFSINVGTAAAQERWERDPEGARKALADVRRSAREAMVEMQAMLHQLRPEALGTAGLIEALREQCEALGYRSGSEVTLELGEPVPDDRMPPGAQDTLFRIGQEMLANVARHARARHVRLWLGRQDEEVILRVEDDGQGFDPVAEVSGMGLRNLKERATSFYGRLEVASTQGSGAGLTVRIPLIPPPLPALMEGNRGILSEFLAMSVTAGIFGSGLWTGPGAEGAAAGFNFDNEYEVTPLTITATVAVVLFLLWMAAWWTGRASPKNIRSLVNRKAEIILSLYIGGWCLHFADGLEAPTAMMLSILSVTTFLYAAGALVWVHRVSEVRRVWRPGARFWLWLLLPVVAVTALSVAWIFDRPGPLTLSAADALCLSIGIVFPYLLSRQRRTEEVPHES
jgi:signal transduction histidine kinase